MGAMQQADGEEKSVILVEAGMQMTERQRIELERAGLKPDGGGEHQVLVFHPELVRPRRAAQQQNARGAARAANSSTGGGGGGGSKTSLVIKAFNYKLRLDLELNDVLFGPNLVQKHFIPKGTHISAHQLDNCYYHAKSSPTPSESTDEKEAADSSGAEFAGPNAIGAFRTCNGLSGIIHVNNESLVIHPFYSADLSKKQPHIIYRYQSSNSNRFNESRASGEQPGDGQAIECGNSLAPNEWRQFGSKRWPLDQAQPQSFPAGLNSSADVPQEEQDRYRRRVGGHLLNKRDVGLTSKYIELALLLSHDMFLKRNTSSRLEVLHDAIQVVNCLDLYFRHSTNTRVGLVYIETWAYGDQIEISDEPRRTLLNLLDYSTRHLYATSKDAVHLITGGHSQQFQGNAFGMAVPDSVCTPNAVSVSQESSILEPFLTAATMAHLLGHNLGMEHDHEPIRPTSSASSSGDPAAVAPSSGALTRQQQQPANSSPPSKWTPLQATHTKNNSNRNNNHQSAHQAESMGDEEEVKSRSLDEAARQQVAPDGIDQLEDQQVVDELTDCRSNCIMSERFVFAPAPVALGNMRVHGAKPADGQQQHHSTAVSIQQASGGGSQAHKTAEMFAVRETSISAPSNASFLPESVEFLDGGGGGGGGGQASSSLPFSFSRQSVETYFNLLRDGRFYCLWNKPNKLESSIAPTCGNGIVEQDEDCDCGSRADCWSDTCCERLTCKFRKGRECISGACCDRCRFRPRGTLCRKARNECDLPEYCDGKSFSCGADLHKQNGWPCNSNSGYCFMGQCPGHETQCAELWGSSGRSADKLCYSQYNTNGTLLGNCGLSESAPAIGRSSGATSSSALSRHPALMQSSIRSSGGGGGSGNLYKRCEPENQMCGTLQCKLGDMKPVTADLDDPSGQSATSHDFSRKVLRVAGRELECKVIIRPGSAHHNLNKQSGLSYVRDGSKCADGRVCFNQTCLTLERAYPEPFELCPRDELGQVCSQHGVCSSANKCHCEPEWTGDDCSRPAPLDRPEMPAVIEITAPSFGRSQHQALEQSGNSSAVSVGSSQVVRESGISTTSTATTPTTTTTTAAAITGAPAPTTPSSSGPQQQQQQHHGTTTSNQIDKSKRSALEATTLVYILVVSVAAVYLGFALMANCYRRKGLIRPDKVLRHHQMNCKMDALRSSFIAKRLADPEGLTLEASPSLSNFNELLTGGSIPNINSTKPWVPLLDQSLASGSSQLVPELHSSLQIPNQKLNLIDVDDEGQLRHRPQAMTFAHQQALQMNAPSSLVTATVHQQAPPAQQAAQQQQQQQASQPPPPPPPNPPNAASKRQTIQATVHYLDRTNRLTGSGDHIPLLVSGRQGGEQVLASVGRRSMNQPAMSSFGLDAGHRASSRHHLQQRQQTTSNWTEHDQQSTTMPNRHRLQAADNDQINDPTPSLHLSQSLALKRTLANTVVPSNGFINRTTSLGSVHRCVQPHSVGDEMYDTETQDEDEGDYEQHLEAAATGVSRHQRGEHCEFATPLRSARPSRHAGRHVRAGSLGHQLRRQSSRDDTRGRDGLNRSLAPEFDSCSAPSSPDGGIQAFWDDELAAQSARHNNHHHNRHQHHLQGARPTSSVAPAPFRLQRHSLERNRGGSRRHLNEASDGSGSRSPTPSLDQFLPPPPPPLDQCWSNLDNHSHAHSHAHAHHHHHHHRSHHPHRPGAQRPPEELLAQNQNRSHLIEQLQQLERVQSGSQQKQAPGDAGLNEFFSLPLSVQLSALLARTLADGAQLESGAASNPQRTLQQSSAVMQIDEYLATLSSTNVIATSRRSFKSANQTGAARAKEQQPAAAAATTTTTMPNASRSSESADAQHQQVAGGSSAANSRGGTLRRQNNVKLQNLQTLISRLQKLHNQTMMRQRLEGAGGDDSADYDEGQLEAASGDELRPNARQPTEATDDDAELNLADGEEEENKIPEGSRRTAETKTDEKLGDTSRQCRRTSSRTSLKNELVYSISDSEDTGETLEAAQRIVAAASRATRRKPIESGAGGDCVSEPNSAAHHRDTTPMASQDAGALEEKGDRPS